MQCVCNESRQDDRVHEHSTQSVNLLLSWLQDDRLHEHSTQSVNLQGQHHARMIDGNYNTTQYFSYKEEGERETRMLT